VAPHGSAASIRAGGLRVDFCGRRALRLIRMRGSEWSARGFALRFEEAAYEWSLGDQLREIEGASMRKLYDIIAQMVHCLT
jgi:hypothetical protein